MHIILILHPISFDDKRTISMLIIGLMSGTSLDGLDIAYCDFSSQSQFQLLAAETIPYSEQWRQRLASLHLASAEEYVRADAELGHLFGEMVMRFRNSHPGPVDCIASHGHTIFHQPSARFTSQIGDPNAIHADTGLPVVADFRRLDVALGGQGAPLVPIGDRMLFGQYDCCINLGGIANISYELNGKRIAYDISPCNMALNSLAAQMGLPYDPDGSYARQGTLLPNLLAKLETLEYYHLQPPKTLGKEWFEQRFLPLLEAFSDHPVTNLLNTVAEHISMRIAASIGECHLPTGKVLVTGGGANNRYLIDRIKANSPKSEIESVNPQIIDFKEAIIFALLAYLRINGKVNALASVTGASRDSSTGAIFGNLGNRI